MKIKYIITLSLFVCFFSILAVITLIANADAREVRDSVVRFHIVANSDSESDQQHKFAVRNGIATLCNSLFKDSKSKSESMQIAEQNKQIIEQKAKEILQKNNNNDPVNVKLTKRFFPTRHYNGVCLPAGVYDTIDITIGQAKGQNFWCVMFPAICLGSSTESENKHKMGEVLQGPSLDLVTKNTPTVKFKFKIVEIFESVKNYFSN